LTELLVVIGVIALLIGILLPTLSRARESSRRTACLANLRSIGQALLAYAQTWKEKLPNGNERLVYYDYNGQNRVMVYFANEFLRAKGWPTDERDPTNPLDTKPVEVRPWKGAEVFWCPSDASPMPRRIVTADWLLEDSARSSYEFFSLWFPPENPARMSKLKGQAPLAWDQDGGKPINPVTNQPVVKSDSPLRNHKGGGNVVFADGHAEFEHEKLWDGESWPHPAGSFYPEN
jgi:prepilin-type processing-associated H-X9-DG protein